MGWTVTHERENYSSTLDYVCAVESFDRANVVAHNTGAGGRELYLAMRCVWADGSRPDDVVGVCVLIENRKVDGEAETATKVMEETMGPYYYNASAKVLDALTPTTNESALTWRAQCREALAAKSARKLQLKAFEGGDHAVVRNEITIGRNRRPIPEGARVRIVERKSNGGLVIAHPSVSVRVKLTPASVVHYLIPEAEKDPPHYLSKVGDRWSLIVGGQAASAMTTREHALAVAKRFKLDVSGRYWDGDAGAWAVPS